MYQGGLIREQEKSSFYRVCQASDPFCPAWTGDPGHSGNAPTYTNLQERVEQGAGSRCFRGIRDVSWSWPCLDEAWVAVQNAKTVRGSHAALSIHGSDSAAILHAWQAVRSANTDFFEACPSSDYPVRGKAYKATPFNPGPSQAEEARRRD